MELVDPKRLGVLTWLARIGAVETDSAEEALRKYILVLGSVLTTTLAGVLVGTYRAFGLAVSFRVPSLTYGAEWR